MKRIYMLKIVSKGIFFFMGTLLAFNIGIALPTDLMAQEIRIRKAIDDLTADELETYIYAVKKIQEISITDPTVEFSYAHMAGLHNIPTLFAGACEHWNHRFFAWHRALLLNYEDALRASDPPRTSKVTIPYWNWTIEASGHRYPVAFENNSNAVAKHYKKSIDPTLLQVLFRHNRNDEMSSPMYTWSYITEIALAQSSEEFLGSKMNHGELENPAHDSMHAFIGGDLVSTATAANDPIFWSFHTFIDLVWWWRQEKITDAVLCSHCSLNGMRTETASSTNGPTLVSDVTDSLHQLSVTYDFAQPTLQVMGVETSSRRLSKRLPWHAAKSLEKPDVLQQFAIRIPATGNSVFVVQMKDVQIPTTLAYIALVFVHPSDVPFAQGSVEFRDRYFVGHFGQWANSHAAHMEGAPATRDFRVEVDRNLYPELLLETGTQLTVSVLIFIPAINNTEPLPSEVMGATSAGTNVSTIIKRETAIGSVVGIVQ